MHHHYLPWSVGWTCKYKASQMLWRTMFPHVSHNKHHRKDTIRMNVGFIKYSTSIILRGLTSLPRFSDTLAPGAFLSRTRPQCPGVSLKRSQELRAWRKWLDFPIATGSMWFYMLDFGWINFASVCQGLKFSLELARVHEIATGNNYHSIWRRILLFILIKHNPSNTRQ